MCEKFEEFDVNFKIISNKNQDIYVEGYVTINDEEAEDVDWYYWNGSGYNNNQIIWHGGVQITGATWEQENEIAQFESDLVDDNEWITDAILQSNDDENRTHVRENVTLIINDGAKMECEIKEPDAFLNMGDYVVELIPQFNGKRIDIASYMAETFEEFDPWQVNDDSSFIEDGHIFFEMSKDYWDKEFKEERIEDVNEEARRIYAMYLTAKLEIGKYDEILEQSIDTEPDDIDLFNLSQLLGKSDEEIKSFLIEAGYIDEELE